MFVGFMVGVLATLAVLFVCLQVFPLLALWARYALWRARNSSAFALAVFDTYLRQRGWKSGPRLPHLTRQARRRIAREFARKWG